MRATFAALVALVLCAVAPVAVAEEGHRSLDQIEHQLVNRLGEHIAIPGVVAGQRFTFDLQLDGFQVRNQQLFAVGILSGGNLTSAVQAAIPVRGVRDHRGRSEPEIRGGFGALPRATPTQPAVLRSAVPTLGRTALVQDASSPLVIQAQVTQLCDIVNLALGETNVNVLGIVVNLQPVVLDVGVAANAGLVGALLCAVVGLL